MPHRLYSPFTRTRIGRRGACLLVFGLIPFFVGLALFVQPTAPGGRNRTIPLLEKIAPAEFWSVAWMVLGSLVFLSAFLGWRAQRRAYMVAYTLPLLWGAAYLISWVFGWLVTGWISGTVYLGYCLLVIVIAGWEESAPSVPILPDEYEAPK